MPIGLTSTYCEASPKSIGAAAAAAGEEEVEAVAWSPDLRLPLGPG